MISTRPRNISKRPLPWRSSSATNSDEKTIWKFLALEGMGLSQTDDVEADSWLDKADKALRSSNLPEDNLRRKRLFAELGYSDEALLLCGSVTMKRLRLFSRSQRRQREAAQERPGQSGRTPEPSSRLARTRHAQSRSRGVGALTRDSGAGGKGGQGVGPTPAILDAGQVRVRGGHLLDKESSSATSTMTRPLSGRTGRTLRRRFSDSPRPRSGWKQAGRFPLKLCTCWR